MTDDKRLQQLIDYARALALMARHGRGNVKDTADIVKALQELQAYREFTNAPTPQPKRTLTQRASKPPQPRRVN